MPEATALPRAGLSRHALSRLWARNKFHLSLLSLLVPAVFIPTYFAQERDMYAYGRALPAKPAGPWTVTITDVRPGPAYVGQAGEHMKDLAVSLAPGQMDKVRGIYLRVGKPRSLRAAGAMGSGIPYKPYAHVPIPPELKGNEELWVTVEGWDGSVHQAAWPLQDLLTGDKS